MGAMSGIQQAIVAAIKTAAENLPPEIQENILQIGQKVAMFQAQLDRLEAGQAEIISLLILKGTANGSEHADGAPRPQL
jgi:hypothetical protein